MNIIFEFFLCKSLSLEEKKILVIVPNDIAVSKEVLLCSRCSTCKIFWGFNLGVFFQQIFLGGKMKLTGFTNFLSL